MNHYQDWLKQHIRKLDGNAMNDAELNALSDEDWEIINNAFNVYITKEAIDAMRKHFSKSTIATSNNDSKTSK